VQIVKLRYLVKKTKFFFFLLTTKNLLFIYNKFFASNLVCNQLMHLYIVSYFS